MSMGNFMGCVGVGVSEMATNQYTTHDIPSDEDEPKAGAGMAHLTVVPTNFEPDSDNRHEN